MFHGLGILVLLLAIHCAAAKVVRSIPAANSSIKKNTKKSTELSKSRRFSFLPDGLKSGIASGLAAIVAKVILQPFDTIKTVQQYQTATNLGPIGTGIDIVKKRGIAGLWSGIGVTVIGSSPSVAIYFGVYSSCKKRLSLVFPPHMKYVVVALSAMIGNTIASVFRVPYEVFKQRIQAGQHFTTWEAVSYSWKNEGLIGLFGGGKLTSQIFRDVPYAMVTLVSYEILQSLLTKLVYDIETSRKINKIIDKSENDKSIFETKKVKDAICGSAAGGLGTLVTTPMDVIKTRMMTSNRYSSVVDASIDIARKEGLGTFFVGTIPRLAHKIPANGIFFLCYELFKTMLDVPSDVEASG